MDFTVNLGLFITITFWFIYSKKNAKNKIQENKERIKEKEFYLITKCIKIFNIIYFFVVIIFVVESILSSSIKLPISFLTFIFAYTVFIFPIDSFDNFKAFDDYEKILINYIFKTPPYLVAFIYLVFSLTIIFLFTYFGSLLSEEIKNLF